MKTLLGPTYLALEEEEDDSIDELPTIDEHVWRRRFFLLLAFFIVVLSVVAFLFFGFYLPRSTLMASEVKEPYSPARKDIQYLNRYLTSDPDTPKFMGNPRPELDQAWHDLLEGTLIRFSAEELKLAGNATSVALKSGGYAGGLGISHSLHCLKRLKQYFHSDYYYSHEIQDWSELESHADHCLESLRQYLLCQPDLNVYTLEWTPHSRVKPTVRVPQPHACVDWSKLHAWMNGRAAFLEDMIPPPPELYGDSQTV